MDTVLGVGVELCGDFALVGGEGERRPLYMASVAGPEAVVKKFEADIVSAWGDAAYAWGRVQVYGQGTYRLLRTRRGGGVVHGLVVSKVFLPEEGERRETDGVFALDGDLPAALGRWLRRYMTLPFLEEWLPYLWRRGLEEGLIRELTTFGRGDVRGALVDRKTEEWGAVLSAGVRSGALGIPDSGGRSGEPVQGLDLDGYLRSWGPVLAARAQAAHRPLWVPGQGERGTEIRSLKEPLYEPQADVVEGLARALRHRQGVILCGAMGTGKTRMGAAIAHRLLGGRGGYRVLVMAPKHLLPKWCREVRAIVPGARAAIVWTGMEMLALLRRLRAEAPKGPEFYVVGRDQAKLGWFYRPGAVWDGRRKLSAVVEDPATGRRRRALVPEPVWRCPRCGRIQVDGKGRPYAADWMKERRDGNLRCVYADCKEPLWQADGSRVRRCAIAEAVRARGKGLFDLLIADECHELKGGGTAQGIALGTLAAACGKTLLLTGTLFGGLALDVFYLLWRIAPEQMLGDGQSYRVPGLWVERYGRREWEVTEEDEVRNKASRSGRRQEPRMRPGISPLVYGRHLLDAAAFIDLEDVAPWLPRYTEIPDPVDMTEEMRQGYRQLSGSLEHAAQQAARRGDLSVYAKWLQTGLGWPDRPHDWPEVCDRDGIVIAVPPKVLPGADGLYPKERWLLEILEHERGRGRKCAVYQTFTGRHDMLVRLEEITRRRGFHPAVLRADKVPPEEREAWIAERLREGADLLLCHPKVVETGLDLYDFPTIIWLQTGTSLFPVRQASRRSYRIGQTQDVEVRFLAYADTLQTAQLLLMARKLRAAAAAEGSVTAEGLRVLAGDDDSALALAQVLVRGMEGLETAEAMWRQAARLGPAPAVEAPKVQTLVRTLPVVSLAPKASRGKRVAQGIRVLAIDFDALASA
jgi:hypothetical protein